jgi:hypothetical protein
MSQSQELLVEWGASEFLTTREAITAALPSAPRDGWVQYADGVVTWREGKRETVDNREVSAALPLAGEFVVDERSSILFRQEGRGWRVWTCSQGRGKPARFVDETLLSSAAGGRSLRYRVYYALRLPDGRESSSDPADLAAWTPAACRFLGWST